MATTRIPNRHGKRLVIRIDRAQDPRGLAFVMHGLGGFKEQPHIAATAEAFLARGITVVRFDTTHSCGESGGDYADATLTAYYEDLEDVIAWARERDFFAEPFYLAGHSLGATSTAWYAIQNTEQIKALVLIGMVISGELFLQNLDEEELSEYRRSGYMTEQRPHGTRALKWAPFEKDILQYDLLPYAHRLTMPSILIVGEHDDAATPENQRRLRDTLPLETTLHIIEGATHTIKEKKHLLEMKQAIREFLKSL